MKNKLFIYSALFGLLCTISVAHATASGFTTDASVGSKGPAVTQLQQFLTDQGLYSGPITGTFGSMTKAAVTAFQIEKGITPHNGRFGPTTRGIANGLLSNATTSTTAVQVSTPVAVTPAVLSTPIDYGSFTQIKLAQYAANPTSYAGQKVEFIGSVVAFLPKGGSGGSTNFISLLDPVANVQVMTEVDSPTYYSTLVSRVKAGDTFRVYGTGVANQNFTNKYGATISTAVIQVATVDDCSAGSSVTNMTSDNSPYGWACAGTMEHITQ